jgi:hypothetical protein
VKAIVLALLAAFAFALGNVPQQKGTLDDRRPSPAGGGDQGLRHWGPPGSLGRAVELDDLRAHRLGPDRVRAPTVRPEDRHPGPAMASSNAVTLFGSVVFGATVFGEKLSSGGARLAPALIGLAVALVGIVLLAGAKPPQAIGGMPRIDQIPQAKCQ